MFSAFGLLAAISYLIDIFFVDGVNPIAFYDPILFNGKSLLEPNGIFLDVAGVNFEEFGESYSLIFINFVDFDLLRSYLGLGN